MNIGNTSMDLPAQFAVGALKPALDTQAGIASQLIAAGTQGTEMVQAAAAEMGKGLKLDMMV